MPGLIPIRRVPLLLARLGRRQLLWSLASESVSKAAAGRSEVELCPNSPASNSGQNSDCLFKLKPNGKSRGSSEEEYLARYTPEIAGLAKSALQKMRKRLPGAVEMSYDYYNALVLGFSPTERPSENSRERPA
jgi:hypothetical protein